MTAIPVLKATTWIVRGLDFPRLQIAVLLLLWIIISSAGFVFGWQVSIIWWVLVIACFFYQAWWVFPYSTLHKTEADWIDPKVNMPKITLLTSNVLMDNRNSKPLMDLIERHKPDVVATLETDTWWQTQLDTLEQYPYRMAHPLDNMYGMHIYSRLPLEDETIDFLVEDDIPSMSMRVRINDMRTIRLHVLHPRPPAPGENEQSIERDVELLLLAKHLQDLDEPVIVSGDLNDVAWSRTTRLFRRISGMLDIRVGRGMLNTFHADFRFIRWPLDHVFVSTHFKVVKVKRLAHIGSDHFPVLATLALGKQDFTAPHLELEDADHDLVKEILDTPTAE